MKVHLQSTDKVVELVVNGVAVPARVWEGVTENGVPLHAFVTRVAVLNRLDHAEFERDLLEQRAPSAAAAAIPARLVLDPPAAAPGAKPAPAPPLSITRPVAKVTELGAALDYLRWLADELVEATHPRTGPQAVALVLHLLVSTALASLYGRHEFLDGLLTRVMEYGASFPSGFGGMTVGEAAEPGIDPPRDPLTN